MTPDNLESIKRRRQAIKIVAGVPTIFTLASGSALAASSSMCMTNVGHPDRPTIVNVDVPPGGLNLDVGDVVDGSKLHPDINGPYAYDGDGRFVTASCWTSMKVTSVKDATSTRIA